MSNGNKYAEVKYSYGTIATKVFALCKWYYIEGGVTLISNEDYLKQDISIEYKSSLSEKDDLIDMFIISGHGIPGGSLILSR